MLSLHKHLLSLQMGGGGILGTAETHEGHNSNGGVQDGPHITPAIVHNNVCDIRHTCAQCTRGTTYRCASKVWEETRKPENNCVGCCVLRHATQVLEHWEGSRKAWSGCQARSIPQAAGLLSPNCSIPACEVNAAGKSYLKGGSVLPQP